MAKGKPIHILISLTTTGIYGTGGGREHLQLNNYPLGLQWLKHVLQQSTRQTSKSKKTLRQGWWSHYFNISIIPLQL